MNPKQTANEWDEAPYRRLRRAFALAGCERGVAAVEFALLVPVLLLIVLGIGDVGLAINTTNNETQLANQGARLAVVDSNPGYPAVSLQEYIKSQGATGPVQHDAEVCIGFPKTSKNIGDPVEVTVSIDFGWPVPSLPLIGALPSKTITGKAVMRLEQTPTAYDEGCTGP